MGVFVIIRPDCAECGHEEAGHDISRASQRASGAKFGDIHYCTSGAVQDGDDPNHRLIVCKCSHYEPSETYEAARSGA